MRVQKFTYFDPSLKSPKRPSSKDSVPHRLRVVTDDTMSVEIVKHITKEERGKTISLSLSKNNFLVWFNIRVLKGS